MNKQNIFCLFLLLVLLGPMLVGCASQKTTSVGLSPEKLGRISAQIERHPDQFKRIISYYNLTPTEYEKAVREVSSDPDMSARYTRAYNQALNK